MSAIRSSLLGGLALSVLMSLGLVALGLPLVFRLVMFAIFALAVINVAYVGDAVRNMFAAHQSLNRAEARVSGQPLYLNREIRADEVNNLIAVARFLSIFGGAIAISSALFDVSALPSSLLVILVSLPCVALATTFTVVNLWSRRAMAELQIVVERLERMHDSVRQLSARISALAGEEAESGMILVANVVIQVTKALHSYPDAVSAEMSFKGFSENPEARSYGLASWINDVTNLLDQLPIEQAQFWVDQLMAEAANIATAARERSDLKLRLEITDAH